MIFGTDKEQLRLMFSTKKMASYIKIISIELLKRITIDPKVSYDKPELRGLRYPVESILEYLEGGDTIEDFLTLSFKNTTFIIN